MTLLVEQAVMGQQGRIVVPAEVREALALKPGTLVTFSVENGEAVISTPLSAARQLQALFADVPRPKNRLASEQFIAERRAETD